MGPPAYLRGLSAYNVVTGQRAFDLAARFRPRLRFDGKERRRPISVTGLLAERANGSARHRFCVRPPAKDGCRDLLDSDHFKQFAGEASTFGDATYIDIAGSRRRSDYAAPEPCTVARVHDCGDSPESAIYYRVTAANDRFYIDYWWFFRYNRFQGACASCRRPSWTPPCGRPGRDAGEAIAGRPAARPIASNRRRRPACRRASRPRGARPSAACSAATARRWAAPTGSGRS